MICLDQSEAGWRHFVISNYLRHRTLHCTIGHYSDKEGVKLWSPRQVIQTQPPIWSHSWYQYFYFIEVCRLQIQAEQGWTGLNRAEQGCTMGCTVKYTPISHFWIARNESSYVGVCSFRYIAAKIINSTEINGYIWDCEYSILNQCNDREKWRLTTKIQRHPIWSIYLQIFERIRIPKISMDTDKTLPNRLPTSKTGWEDSGLSIFRRTIDWWIQGCNRRRNNSQVESLADEILYLNKPLKMRKLFYFLITK